jgi:hypothetical protein
MLQDTNNAVLYERKIIYVTPGNQNIFCLKVRAYGNAILSRTLSQHICQNMEITMRKILLTGAALTLMCGAALAQTSTGPAPQGDNVTKPGMTNGTMDKGGMNNTTGMNNNSMSKDGMSNDGMSKNDPKKEMSKDGSPSDGSKEMKK